MADGELDNGHGDERFGIASYNIHGCVGLDRRCKPQRIVRVLNELDCDAVALQEVNSRPGPHADSMQLDYLASQTGMQAIAGSTILRHLGHYGNALLTRCPVLAVRRHDFSFSKREPRGALDVDLAIHGRPVRVIVTHLGLNPGERRYQVRQLLKLLHVAEPDQPVVVCGDINEWLPLGRPLRWLHGVLGKPPILRTWPVWMPLLALDRIWVRPRHALLDLRAHRSFCSRMASDHLPLKAIVASLVRGSGARQAPGKTEGSHKTD
ncbi:MAG: endonuclease/exonuclease/phosphatase family protein [Pseudomonadota bacterium]|nr:endonuclease/exonuclease/phosphatase family protein [Burkholderiales bacterium]MDQ3194908.1 endonuclease/exonuclease/phosphatase family protein [Pseudomonadota bacterium]